MSSSLISATSSADAKQLGLPNVAFCGRAGAGKSTAAQLLAELGYQIRSFAKPLKDVAATIWGEEARTDRDKLQKLGVAVRVIDPDAWVRLLIRSLRPMDYVSMSPMPQLQPMVVDDLRFENEWWGLKSEGFVIVRISALPSRRVDRLKGNGKWQSEEQLEHVSEVSLDHLKADYSIVNDGDTIDLYDELTEILIRERKRR